MFGRQRLVPQSPDWLSGLFYFPLSPPNCHPERNDCSAKRSRHAVEGPHIRVHHLKPNREFPPLATVIVNVWQTASSSTKPRLTIGAVLFPPQPPTSFCCKMSPF